MLTGAEAARRSPFTADEAATDGAVQTATSVLFFEDCEEARKGYVGGVWLLSVLFCVGVLGWEAWGVWVGWHGWLLKLSDLGDLVVWC